MNGNEIAKAIEDKVRAIFPDSALSVRYTRNLYPLITLRFAKEKTWSNNIIQNDPFFTMLFIDGFNDAGEAYPKQKLEVRCINRAFPLRGKTAEAEKIIAYLERYFSGIKNLLDKV